MPACLLAALNAHKFAVSPPPTATCLLLLPCRVSGTTAVDVQMNMGTYRVGDPSVEPGSRPFAAIAAAGAHVYLHGGVTSILAGGVYRSEVSDWRVFVSGVCSCHLRSMFPWLVC